MSLSVSVKEMNQTTLTDLATHMKQKSGMCSKVWSQNIELFEDQRYKAVAKLERNTW